MDPDEPAPGVGDGALLRDAPAGALDALVTLAGPGADTPLLSVELRHLGGALARDAGGGGAQALIDAEYALLAVGFAPTPQLDTAVRAHARAAKDAIGPWRAPYDYYNFAEIPAPADALLPRAAHRRLRAIKASYDPDEAIISAHPIRSAGVGS